MSRKSRCGRSKTGRTREPGREVTLCRNRCLPFGSPEEGDSSRPLLGLSCSCVGGRGYAEGDG